MILATALLSIGPISIDPWLRLEADAVYAEAEVPDGDEDVDASAIIGEVTVGATAEFENTEITVSALTEYVEFADPDFTDRFRHRGRIELRQDVDENWQIRLRADRSLRFPSAEYFDIDETELRARVRFEPVREHRLGGAIRWRERGYNDGTDSTGDGPRIDGEYRYRFGRYHYFEVEARYETIDSDDPRRNYSRRAAAISYTRPLTDDLRVRPKLAYRETDYPGRIVEGAVFREDRRWVPEVEFLWWPGDWRMSAEFQYQARQSTEPDRTQSGPRVQVTVAYVF